MNTTINESYSIAPASHAASWSFMSNFVLLESNLAQNDDSGSTSPACYIDIPSHTMLFAPLLLSGAYQSRGYVVYIRLQN